MLINMIRNHHIKINENDSILETEQDTVSIDSRRLPKDSANYREMDKENQDSQVKLTTLLSCGVWPDQPKQGPNEAPIRRKRHGESQQLFLSKTVD